MKAFKAKAGHILTEFAGMNDYAVMILPTA
jgi:hypothetical protein